MKRMRRQSRDSLPSAPAKDNREAKYLCHAVLGENTSDFYSKFNSLEKQKYFSSTDDAKHFTVKNVLQCLAIRQEDMQT